MIMRFEELLRDNIRELVPYSSARSEFKGKAEVLLDANENPFDYSSNRYPDPLQKELKQALGSFRGVSANKIFLGNGSDEIIELLIRAFCEPNKDSISYFTPGFGMYKVAAQLNAVATNVFALDESFSLDEKAFVANLKASDKLVFITSPNNPTANAFALEKVKYVAANFQGLVVLDEAYIDFSEIDSGLTILDEYENLIVLQTFSKAFGAAGIRLGMGFMHPDLVSILNKVKMPYNISELTQQEAVRILDKPERIQEAIKVILGERERVSKALSNLKQVQHIYPSDTNFLLVKFADPNKVYQSLTDQGIILRNRSNLKGCEGCLRITIGLPNENDKMLEALKSLDA